MGTLSDFFNRSKFEARPRTGNKKEVLLDTEYLLELDIYDVLALDVPAIVSGNLAVLATGSRKPTPIATSVIVTSAGSFSYLVQFTIATGEWDGSSPLILQLDITDHDAYVYKLDYQIKV